MAYPSHRKKTIRIPSHTIIYYFYYFPIPKIISINGGNRPKSDVFMNTIWILEHCCLLKGSSTTEWPYKKLYTFPTLAFATFSVVNQSLKYLYQLPVLYRLWSPPQSTTRSVCWISGQGMFLSATSMLTNNNAGRVYGRNGFSKMRLPLIDKN